MLLSELITRLQAIKQRHGDLQVGSDSCSPDEGLTYELADINVNECNDNSKCVCLSFSESDALDDHLYCDEDEEGDDSFEDEIMGACVAIATAEEDAIAKQVVDMIDTLRAKSILN